MNPSTCLIVFLATCGAVFFSVEARVGRLSDSKARLLKKTFEEIDINIDEEPEGEDVDVVIKGNGPKGKGKEEIDVEFDLEEELDEAATDGGGDETNAGDIGCPELVFAPFEKIETGIFSVTFKMKYPTCTNGAISKEIGTSAVFYSTTMIHDHESESPHQCMRNKFFTCVTEDSGVEVHYMTAACSKLGGVNAAHVHFYISTQATTETELAAPPEMCDMSTDHHKICPYEIELLCADPDEES